MDRPEIAQMIKTDLEDGTSFNVRQTPTFFINGAPLQKFGPDQLREAIAAELK